MMKFVRKMLFAFLFGAMLIPAGFAAEKKKETLPTEVQCPECKKQVKVPKELCRPKKKKKKSKKKKKNDKAAETEKSAAKSFKCPKCKKPISYPPGSADKKDPKAEAAGTDANAEGNTDANADADAGAAD